MARTFKDLQLALGLNLKQFFAAAAEADRRLEKTKRDAAANPVKLTAEIDDKALNKELKETEKKIESTPVDLNVTYEKTFSATEASYKDTKRKIEKNPIKVKSSGVENLTKKIVALGAAYAGLNTVNNFREFETSLANVESLGVENIESLRQSIVKIGLDAPIALNQLPAGLYNIVSASVDASEQINVLESSVKAAKAGLAEQTEAVNLGAAVIKGYGKEWSDFDNIMDQSFQTVKLGQTTFPELAANVGKVVPGFASLKIGAEELFGAFATLTGVTGGAAEVSTQLASISRGLSQPTAELTALIQEQTGATVEAFVAQEGLAGVLDILAKATNGSSTEMSKYFKRAEALNALLALTTSQADDFARKTDAMSKATGAATEAFNVQAKTLDSQLQILENRFTIITNGLLTGVAPALNAVLSPISDVFKGFASLDANTRNLMLAIGGLTFALFKLPKAIAAVRVAVKGLQASLGPAGWLLLGLSVIAEAWLIYTDNAAEAAEANRKFAESTNALADAFNRVNKATRRDIEKKTTEDLLEIQKLLNFELAQAEANLSKVNKAYATNAVTAAKNLSLEEQARQEARLKENIAEQASAIAAINSAKARLAAVSAVLLERKEVSEDIKNKEIADLDDLRAYEFRTGRIKLAEYVAYLKARQSALKTALGEENIEYLKFFDNLQKLQAELDAQNLFEKLPDAEFSTGIEAILKPLLDLNKVSTDFKISTFEALQTEYDTRRILLETNLLTLEQIYGQESEIYQRELRKRELLDIKYHQAKEKLAFQGAKAAIAIGAQLMEAFQGDSLTLFATGKALSIANATINAVEAVSRAYKDYPWPFNLAVAGIQAALGYAQVKKIEQVQFKPPAGKATGGPVTGNEFLGFNIPVPRGEHGYIAVQRGEYVINQGATKAFYPLLDMINSGRARPAPIPAPTKKTNYATGGPVTQVIQPAASEAGAEFFDFAAGVIRDAVIEGFNRSQIRVSGQFTAKGKDLKTVIDKDAELTTDL